MQAMEVFLGSLGLGWATKIFGILLAVGAIAMMSTWLVGPSTGLLATARNGDLPPLLSRVNRNHMPVPILIVQALIGTFLSLLFLFMPNVSASYWLLTDLTAQLTAMIYIIMFAAALRLRYSQPDTPRPYRIPGGNAGMWIVAGVGILASLSALFIGFVPPSQVKTGNIFFYEAFLILGIIVLSAPPFLFYRYKKPSWVDRSADEGTDH
jgi:amino acid transporter